ncbi:MAG: redoxin domain-containing protein [Myxococcales bacterium]|nr:redoxin domain-containing protein [Myxococcales bacterium]
MRTSLIALSLILLAAPALADDEEEMAAQIAQQHQQIAALQEQLDHARQQVQQLTAEVDLTETRLGLRAFRPRIIKRMEGGLTWKPGKVMVVERPGARARKDDLGKFASGQRGYVVSLWATWCKPCTTPEEIAATGRLKAELERMGSTLVGVAVDDLKKITTHARANEWHHPIWQRENAHIEWLPKAFIDRVGLGLPLFLVATGDGRLLYWHASPLTDEVQRELITAAVSAR